jgi:PAS domain S-box-containing protein
VEAAQDTPASRQHVSTILEDMGAVAIATDLEGRVISVSGAVRSLFGYEPREILGTTLCRLVSPETKELVAHRFRRQLTEGSDVAAYPMTVVTKTGGRLRVHATTALLHDEGRPSGLAAILHPAPQLEAAREVRPRPTLTPRQHEILILLSEGLSTDTIAGRLHIQRDTVRNHIRSLLRALNSHSRLEAVVNAHRSGLI